jgi:Peptidase M10 serralysin C terminal
VFSGLNLIIGGAFDSGNSVSTRDIVADFVAGQDKLDFSGIDANLTLAALGNQAFTWVASAGGAFTGPAQLRHRFEFVGTQEYTIVEGNVNNSNGSAEFQVALVGHHTLTATDIIL